MAIASLSNLRAGLLPSYVYSKQFTNAGGSRFASGAFRASLPPAGTPSSAGLAGEALTAWDGAIPFSNPPSGNTYLARFSALVRGGSPQGSLFLCDRLWHNSGIDATSTGIQTINSVTFPARDRNGSTNGEAVFVAIETQTAMGTATPVLTMNYTNSAGVSGQSNFTAALPSALAANALIPIPLDEGDVGVRSIQNIQQDVSWVSGTYALVAYRIVACIPAILAGPFYQQVQDYLDLGLPRLYDNSCLFMIRHTSANAGGSADISGEIAFAQG